MFKCMCEGCFLNILLNFVSELLSVFSDGHDDLRHRIQHQIVHLWTKTKQNKAKHFTMIPECREVLQMKSIRVLVSDLVFAPSSLPGRLFMVTGALVRFPCRCRTWWDSMIV